MGWAAFEGAEEGGIAAARRAVVVSGDVADCDGNNADCVVIGGGIECRGTQMSSNVRG